MSEAANTMNKPIFTDERVKRSALLRFAPIGLIIAGLVLGYAMGWQRFFTLEFLTESRASLRGYVETNPIQSVLAFSGIYALATAVSFPAASILTIFAGFMFGWLIGGISVAVSATIGATALFLAARSAIGDFLKDKVGGRVEKLASGFEDTHFLS